MPKFRSEEVRSLIMTQVDYVGGDFIGQNALRHKINFLLNGYQNTKFIDNLMFVAQRGDGKTHLCRKIGQNLKKKFIEINGSSVKSVAGFVDQVVIPHISNDQDVTLFIDELACVNPKVLEWLLSVLQYDPHTKQSQAVSPDGVEHRFNFKHLTFLSASTNPEKLSRPLKSRLRSLEFEPYKAEDLVQILRKYSPGIEYPDKVDYDVAMVSRGSPREISLRLANDIQQYLSLKPKDKNLFTHADWRHLRSILSIKPLGLTPNEEKLLRILANSPKTLTNLTGAFNLDWGTLRREIELYPLSQDLINIHQKRQITKKGMEVLKEIEAWR